MKIFIVGFMIFVFTFSPISVKISALLVVTPKHMKQTKTYNETGQMYNC